MSGAWAEIVNADGSDEWLKLCAAALVEIQAETSRRNARKIRAMDEGVVHMSGRRVSDVDLIADLIDPKEESTS
ncbi:hypothetical protein OG436_29515 [Streptomyces caniferus]|uniref:hypothetical protein n=1 Tax=Streptomyces caniferus TaxID=285557 RepID=UPI002E2D69F7|nr:hypothetical protein [Streptomyces caniferus]